MTTISIVHTKGGVGKTTTAIHLSTVAAREGYQVTLVDADTQGSACDWIDDAADIGQKMPFEFIRAPKTLEYPDRELVIIDTPPGTEGVIQKAIDIADIVIIPCGASPIELARVWPTIDMTSHVLSFVLLTQVDFRGNLWGKTKQRFAEKNVPLLKSMIPHRQSIKKSFGTVPTSFHGYDDLLGELKGLL